MSQIRCPYPSPGLGGWTMSPDQMTSQLFQWGPCECHVNLGPEKPSSESHGGDGTQAGADGGDKGVLQGGMLVALLPDPARRGT